ncbi:MAG: DNA-binding protein AraC-type [Herbinix sp.]|jgi:AraC-like DNA-binding protein|nr:DNA-binding protein AraC-type [Herbinix sp.]
MKNYSYEYFRDNEKEPICWRVHNNSFWPHFHSSIEIAYVTSGELRVTLNGQVNLVKKNSIIIIPSYFIHSYATETSSSAYIFTIPLDSIPSYKATFLKKTFSTLLVEDLPFEKELLYCMDAICDMPKNMNPVARENMVKGYTYVMLGLLVNHVGLTDIPNTKFSSLAQEILIYLQENYLKPLSLDIIAEQFGYSKSRFSHIFNEFFNCKIIEYINGLRCRHAMELLHEKNATITEIALSSGYDSTRTFYRAFRQCFGCTPNEYLAEK